MRLDAYVVVASREEERRRRLWCRSHWGGEGVREGNLISGDGEEWGVPRPMMRARVLWMDLEDVVLEEREMESTEAERAATSWVDEVREWGLERGKAGALVSGWSLGLVSGGAEVEKGLGREGADGEGGLGEGRSTTVSSASGRWANGPRYTGRRLR